MTLRIHSLKTYKTLEPRSCGSVYCSPEKKLELRCPALYIRGKFNYRGGIMEKKKIDLVDLLDQTDRLIDGIDVLMHNFVMKKDHPKRMRSALVGFQDEMKDIVFNKLMEQKRTGERDVSVFLEYEVKTNEDKD